MSDIKVSIIMPVYKVEKYVAKAIDSILAQSLQEWEFYIVDDGTPDRSGEICDEYAAKDPRIHVIHQENAGAPAARNKAMDLAQGEYLYFMDSDDWAEPTMLDEMYHLAKRDNAQLVISGFFIDTFYDSENFVRDEKRESRRFIKGERTFTRKPMICLTITSFIPHGTSFTKEPILKNISFASHRLSGMTFHLF